MAVNRITPEDILAIKNKSPYGLPDNPSAQGYSPTQIKNAMSGFVTDSGENDVSVVKEINRIVDEMNGDEGKADKTSVAAGLSEHNSSASAHSGLFGGKVDKVDGKGLSENDYTDEDKALVQGAYQTPAGGIPKSDLASALKNEIEGKSAVSVSSTGTSTTEGKYITVDGAEYKISGGGNGVWGEITGTLADQTDLAEELDDLEDAITEEVADHNTSASAHSGILSAKADLVEGKVPANQLPSFVDDVVEGYYHNGKFYEEQSHRTEITGETGKIYVDLATNKTYRWGGTTYAIIGESLALGETSSTAYRGDRGKTAYDHSQVTTGNPHNVTAAQVGAATGTDVTNAVSGHNSSSSAHSSLFGNKVDKVNGKGLSENDFTTALKNKLDGIESGAEVNDIEDVKVNGTSVVANKVASIPAIPSKTSDLTNDSGFIGSTELAEALLVKQNSTDNTLNTNNKTIAGGINEVFNVAKGKNKNIVFVNYSDLVDDLNDFGTNKANIGDTCLITQLDVPDLWVAKVEETHVPYTYTTDAAFIAALTGDSSTTLQIGYFRLCKLETTKVDLAEYVTFNDYASSAKGGVVRVDDTFATSINYNYLVATIKAWANYASMHGNAFIGKGTLDNVLNHYLPLKEDAANKVTSLTPASTDAQYPSAKAVYDELTDKENIGKITIAGTEYTATRKALTITNGGVTTTYYVADIT